jgi:hypothetical protein
MAEIKHLGRRASATLGGRRIRVVGRLVLWVILAVVFARGLSAIAAGRADTAPEAPRAVGAKGQAVDAFAVRFARAYLSDSSPASLEGLLAPGVTIAAGGGGSASDQHVAQATVTTVDQTGHRRFVITVACELVDGNVQFLAVPVASSGRTGAAALGAPAFVSAPGISEAIQERSQSVLGADAGEIRQLAAKFVEAYLSGTSPSALEYLTTPTAEIVPVGELESVSTVQVRQLGSESGSARTVTVDVVARSATGATYPVSYRLHLERRDRWYVSAIEGELK